MNQDTTNHDTHDTIVCLWAFPRTFKSNVQHDFLPVVAKIRGVSRASFENPNNGSLVFVRIEFCDRFYDAFRRGRKLQEQIRVLAAELCAIDLDPQVLTSIRYINPDLEIPHV